MSFLPQMRPLKSFDIEAPMLRNVGSADDLAERIAKGRISDGHEPSFGGYPVTPILYQDAVERT